MDHYYNINTPSSTPSYMPLGTVSTAFSASRHNMTRNEDVDSTRKTLFPKIQILKDKLLSITDKFHSLLKEAEDMHHDVSDTSTFMLNFVKCTENQDPLENITKTLCKNIDKKEENEYLMMLVMKHSVGECEIVLKNVKYAQKEAMNFLSGYDKASIEYHERFLRGSDGALSGVLHKLDESVNAFAQFVKEVLSIRIDKIQSIIHGFMGKPVTIWSQSTLNALFKNDLVQLDISILKACLRIKSLNDLLSKSKEDLLNLLVVLDEHHYRGTKKCDEFVERAVKDGVIAECSKFLCYNISLYHDPIYNEQTLQGLVGIYLGLDDLGKGFTIRKGTNLSPVWNNPVEEGFNGNNQVKSALMEVDSFTSTPTQFHTDQEVEALINGIWYDCCVFKNNDPNDVTKVEIESKHHGTRGVVPRHHVRPKAGTN